MSSNTPQLRFAEFSGEWQETTIKNVLTIGSGRDYKHLDNGNIPVYGTGGLMSYVNDYLYDGESVCIGRKGTISSPMYLEGKFWTVDTLFYTHSFNKIAPKFFKYIAQNINWLKYNEASGVPSLSKSTIEKIEIRLPDIDEQQKIGRFLSAVDSKIEGLEQELGLLKRYKQGIMQRLFNQTIRFKDNHGNSFPDWQETKLGTIVKKSKIKIKIILFQSCSLILLRRGLFTRKIILITRLQIVKTLMDTTL